MPPRDRVPRPPTRAHASLHPNRPPCTPHLEVGVFLEREEVLHFVKVGRVEAGGEDRLRRGFLRGWGGEGGSGGRWRGRMGRRAAPPPDPLARAAVGARPARGAGPGEAFASPEPARAGAEAGRGRRSVRRGRGRATPRSTAAVGPRSGSPTRRAACRGAARRRPGWAGPPRLGMRGEIGAAAAAPRRALPPAPPPPSAPQPSLTLTPLRMVLKPSVSSAVAWLARAATGRADRAGRQAAAGAAARRVSRDNCMAMGGGGSGRGGADVPVWERHGGAAARPPAAWPFPLSGSAEATRGGAGCTAAQPRAWSVQQRRLPSPAAPSHPPPTSSLAAQQGELAPGRPRAQHAAFGLGIESVGQGAGRGERVRPLFPRPLSLPLSLSRRTLSAKNVYVRAGRSPRSFS